MSKIMLSYRQRDGMAAGRLYDRLAARYRSDKVYRDVNRSRPAEDFRASIGSALKDCQIVLAVVGPHWNELEGGRRRLHNPSDWVRIELETALFLKTPVLPVLLDGGTMPSKDDLPETLHSLPFLQWHEIDPLYRFEQDVERLFAIIDEKLAADNTTESGSESNLAKEAAKATAWTAVGTALVVVGEFLWASIWPSSN